MNQPQEMSAYIDEAGDEGIDGKGTKWFIISALILSQAEASALGETYQRIRQRIKLVPGKPLHWVELSHARRKAVMNELSKIEFCFSSIVVNTRHQDIVRAIPKLSGRRLYFHAFGQLVERVTWYCNDRDCKVRIYPENKGGITRAELKGYLDYMQSQPGCEIRKGCILSVNPKSKTQSNLIQITDSICGALQNAVEANYDVIEESHLLAIKDKFYKHDDKVFGYGIKFIPYNNSLLPRLLEGELPWLNRL